MGSHGEVKERALKFNEVTDTALELESNERKLRANDYVQDRGIFQRGAADNLNHVDFFGGCYLEALKQLNEDDTWLHIGPGNFYAEVDYFTSPLFPTHAKVVSNVYCLSQSPQALTNLEFLKRHDKFRCINGVKFQDLRHVHPVKARLISDVFAAGSYDSDLFGFSPVPGLPDRLRGNPPYQPAATQRSGSAVMTNTDFPNGSLDTRIPCEPEIAKVWQMGSLASKGISELRHRRWIQPWGIRNRNIP